MADDGVQIAQDCLGWDPADSHASGSQPCVPLGVAFKPVATLMRLAIHFNRKQVTWTAKVQHIDSCGMLAPEA